MDDKSLPRRLHKSEESLQNFGRFKVGRRNADNERSSGHRLQHVEVKQQIDQRIQDNQTSWVKLHPK